MDLPNPFFPYFFFFSHDLPCFSYSVKPAVLTSTSWRTSISTWCCGSSQKKGSFDHLKWTQNCSTANSFLRLQNKWWCIV